MRSVKTNRGYIRADQIVGVYVEDEGRLAVRNGASVSVLSVKVRALNYTWDPRFALIEQDRADAVAEELAEWLWGETAYPEES